MTDYAEATEAADPDRIDNAILQLAPHFGDMTVGDVSDESCQEYARKRRGKGVSDGTIRRELGVLRAAINRHYRTNRLKYTVPLWLPPPPPPKDDHLTRSEVARVIRAARKGRARDHLPLAILIGVYTGRRPGAVLSLQWSQVDLESGWIDFDDPGRRQTNKKRGRVRIHRKLAIHLRLARRRATAFDHVIRYAGRPVKDIGKALDKACENAEVRRVTPHIWRHTCCSWLVQKRYTDKEVGEFVGMSPEMVRKVYGHLHPDYQQSIMDAFG